jgi:predicted PurR-regulated permease PerM
VSAEDAPPRHPTPPSLNRLAIPDEAAREPAAAFVARRQRARYLVIALALALLYALYPYAVGLLAIPVLYVACERPYHWLAPRTGRSVAALVMVVLTLLLILLPAAWVLAIVFDQAPAIVRGVSESDLLARLGALRVGELDLGATVSRVGELLVERLSTTALGVFGSATRGVLNLIIALTGLFYLLRSAEQVWWRVSHWLPFSESAVERLRVRFYSVTEATLVGTLLVALVQGSIVGVAFVLVGLPNAAFWGVVTAFASILPVVGSALVWLPGVAVLAGSGRWAAALMLAAIGGILASNIDNIIRPMINRRVSQIHPLTTLLGAFAGLELFGLIGVLLGPLAISYFFELLRMYRREYGGA